MGRIWREQKNPEGSEMLNRECGGRTRMRGGKGEGAACRGFAVDLWLLPQPVSWMLLLLVVRGLSQVAQGYFTP